MKNKMHFSHFYLGSIVNKFTICMGFNMDDKRVDDIVDMIDNFMGAGGGHMNIKISEDENTTTKIEVSSTNECNNSDMACKVPTLHKGFDNDGKENK